MLFASLINRKFFKISAIIVIAVFITLITASVFITFPKTYYKGITVHGIDISGLNREDAKTAVEKVMLKKLENARFILKYRSSIWSFKPKDISMNYLFDEALEEAYKTGRKGNIFKRAYDVLNLRFSGKNIALKTTYERKSLVNMLSGIKEQIDKKGKNASVNFINGDIKINKEQLGRHLDIDKNVKLIENHIVKGIFAKIDLIVKEKKPAILYENIKDINSVLSSFSTVFNPNDVNRTQNLKISCSRINGLILLPGAAFSMNKVLGPRTVENGYKEAKVIFKSEYVNGVGGGVCQITTTLYDAVLLSRLKVVEREHHTLPSVYVGPGQDATIAENYIDFKFKNDKDYAICINAEIVKNKVQIRILGKSDGWDYEVKLSSDVVEEYPPEEEEIIIDDTVEDGKEVMVQHPKNGCRVILYRELYNRNGDLVEREKISDDVYKPIKAQIKVNSKHLKAKKGLLTGEEDNIQN
ncbi:MAG: VanW family protein [Clostridia bacterium]|nr:VanW family protein [Clostridia bacterium]